jgi:hypothetical protein
MFNKTGTASTHNKSCMEAYQGGAVTIGVGVGLAGFSFFLVFGLLCRHTAGNSITAEMHTSGVQ